MPPFYDFPGAIVKSKQKKSIKSVGKRDFCGRVLFIMQLDSE
jgi:hypothetical protein